MNLQSNIADIEIAGFFAAIFAWGNRTTIINKSKELLQKMDNAPYAFCTQHQPKSWNQARDISVGATFMLLGASDHRSYKSAM